MFWPSLCLCHPLPLLRQPSDGKHHVHCVRRDAPNAFKKNKRSIYSFLACRVIAYLLMVFSFLVVDVGSVNDAFIAVSSSFSLKTCGTTISVH